MTSNDQSSQNETSRQCVGLSPESKQILVGLLTRAQVAQRLGVCTHTVQRLTSRGQLPALVFNRRLIRYEPGVVDKFIESAVTE